jgi:hypothetical protein
MTLSRSPLIDEPTDAARRSYEERLTRWGNAGGSPRRRWISLALVVVALLLLGAGIAVVAAPDEDPGTPLGAAGELPGGLARINGVIPLESDGWVPPEPVAALAEEAPEGMHRVRIVLELTALAGEGIDFSASEYTIDGLGSGSAELVWADPATQRLQPGDSINATLVYQIPNQSIALTIEGANGVRLALGTGHHTPGR